MPDYILMAVGFVSLIGLCLHISGSVCLTGIVGYTLWAYPTIRTRQWVMRHLGLILFWPAFVIVAVFWDDLKFR